MAEIIASCGHSVANACDTVTVRLKSEYCQAGHGFVPSVIYGEYCPSCADNAKTDPDYLDSESAVDAFLA